MGAEEGFDFVIDYGDSRIGKPGGDAPPPPGEDDAVGEGSPSPDDADANGLPPAADATPSPFAPMSASPFEPMPGAPPPPDDGAVASLPPPDGAEADPFRLDIELGEFPSESGAPPASAHDGEAGADLADAPSPFDEAPSGEIGGFDALLRDAARHAIGLHAALLGSLATGEASDPSGEPGLAAIRRSGLCDLDGDALAEILRKAAS